MQWTNCPQYENYLHQLTKLSIPHSTFISILWYFSDTHVRFSAHISMSGKTWEGRRKGFYDWSMFGRKNESITFHENLTSLIHLVIRQIDNFLSRSFWHHVCNWKSVVVRQSCEAPNLIALLTDKSSCESRAENELMKYKKHEVNSLSSC